MLVPLTITFPVLVPLTITFAVLVPLTITFYRAVAALPGSDRATKL